MAKFKIQIKSKIQNLNTRVLLFVISVFICHLSFVICHYAYAQDKIIAIVNNDAVTQRDLDDFVAFSRMQLSAEYSGKALEEKIQSIKLNLLDRLVEDRLILQEAKKNKIKVDDNRVKAKIDEIKSHYPTDKEFQEALRKQGLVQLDIETKIKDQMLMYEVVEGKIKNKIVISPTEVTNFYQRNPDEFKSAQMWEFDAVASDDIVTAKQISEMVKAGAEISGAAKKYSLEPQHLMMREGQLKKDVEGAIFKLNPGEVSAPLVIENKYYVFKLNNKVSSRRLSLSESQDEVFSFLYSKKMQEALINWLDELKKQSYVKIAQN